MAMDAAAAAPSQLTIVADGDSWCAYPRLLGTSGGLADHLAATIGARLINLSKDGDASEETFGLKNAARITDALKDHPQIFLLTSGGDDFAGDQFRLAINQNHDGDVARGVNWAWFNAALDEIIADYQELQRLRDQYSPNTLIISQSYGFPPATMMGVPVKICGVTVAGPWLQPGFIDRGWTRPADQAAIVALMLKALEDKLAAFAALDPMHLHVNLQPLLQPWHFGNELHFTAAGWDYAAQQINAAYLLRTMKS